MTNKYVYSWLSCDRLNVKRHKYSHVRIKEVLCLLICIPITAVGVQGLGVLGSEPTENGA